MTGVAERENCPRLCVFEKWLALNFSFRSDPLVQYDHPRDDVFMGPRLKGFDRSVVPLIRAREVSFVVASILVSVSAGVELLAEPASTGFPASGLGCPRSLGSLILLSGVTVKNVTRCCHRLLPLIVFSGMRSAIIANCRASQVSLLETMLLGGGCSSSSSAQDQFQLPAATFWTRGLSRMLSPLSDLSVAFCR